MSSTPASITLAINPSQHFTNHAGATTFDLAALPGTTPSPTAFLLPASAPQTEAFAGSAFATAEVAQPAAVSFLFPVYFSHPMLVATTTADLAAADAVKKAAAFATLAAAMPPAKAFGVLLQASDTASALATPGLEVRP